MGREKYKARTEVEKIESLAVHKALKLLMAILENEDGIKIRPIVIKRVKENWNNGK